MKSPRLERLRKLTIAGCSLVLLMVAAPLLAAVSFASPAEAQVPGSYMRSCRDIRQTGSTLRATCKKVNGFTVSAALTVSGCVGDIWNANGLLTCKRGPAAAPPRPAVAQGGGQDRCHTYATEMISMDSQARGHRCPGWRSHSNYQHHYNWCSARPPAAAQRALGDWGTTFQGCRFKMGF